MTDLLAIAGPEDADSELEPAPGRAATVGGYAAAGRLKRTRVPRLVSGSQIFPP